MPLGDGSEIRRPGRNSETPDQGRRSLRNPIGSATVERVEGDREIRGCPGKTSSTHEEWDVTFSNFFSDYLGNLEWLDVIIGGVLLLAIGWIWYGPLFGKMWSQVTGREMASGTPDPMTAVKGFFQFFIYGIGLSLIMPALHVAFQNASSFETLIVTSFVISFLIVGMATIGRYVWYGGSLQAWLIDWGFWFVGSFAYGYVVLDLLV
jgi:hypothetical protein